MVGSTVGSSIGIRRPRSSPASCPWNPDAGEACVPDLAIVYTESEQGYCSDDTA